MKTLKRKKSLAETHPDIARQWHPTKNGTLTPHDVPPRSGKKAWWVCDKGHDDWLALISGRTKEKPTGCPVCVYTRSGTLAEKYPDIARQWHPTKNLPLTPHDVPPRSAKKAWWVCDKGHDDWLTRIYTRTKKKPTGCPKCSEEVRGEKTRKAALRKSRSLAKTHPDIARQWHPTKNLPLTPDDVTYGSNTKAWWVCDKGHNDWLTVIKSRTSKKPSGCPKCSEEVRGEIARRS